MLALAQYQTQRFDTLTSCEATLVVFEQGGRLTSAEVELSAYDPYLRAVARICTYTPSRAATSPASQC